MWPPEPLSEESIRRSLASLTFVKRVVYLPAAGSTNDAARDLAAQGAPHATLVVTDDQTSGRGRLGRSWHMPPRAGLAMSILAWPKLAAPHAGRLTMLAGLAAAEGLEQATGLVVRLKWPNDVVVEDGDRRAGVKKLGGILVETALVDDRVEHSVAGIGLNVNVDFADRPDLAETATSAMLLTGRPVDRLGVLAAVVARYAARFDWLQAGDALRAAWAARLVTLNRRVDASAGDETISGLAESVDAEGALLVRADDGRLRRLLAADVTLRA